MLAIERDNPTLKGVLPKDYAHPRLDKQRLGQLIDLVGNIGLGDKANRSKDILGRVYEYFLSEFASAEGKKGGQFYTPRCVVRLLVAMLAPYKGRVFDPCQLRLGAAFHPSPGPERPGGLRAGQRQHVVELLPKLISGEAAGAGRGAHCREGNVMATVSTIDVLQSLGFVRNTSGMPDEFWFDFGNLSLSTCALINRSFQPVVSCSGVLSTTRTVREIEFEMPPACESREQCIAWVVWGLDGGGSERFAPARVVDWLEEGRSFQHLLPWVREKALFDARPHCWVSRDFMKVALKHLAVLLDGAAEDVQVVFAFDGEVLTIRVAGKLTAVPADGRPWQDRFAVRAGELRRLPTRFTNNAVGVSVGTGAIHIGNHMYRLIPAEVQP